jgi:hypothetical protein
MTTNIEDTTLLPTHIEQLTKAAEDQGWDHLDGTGEAARRLTDSAHSFGEVNCFIDPEGVYIE